MKKYLLCLAIIMLLAVGVIVSISVLINIDNKLQDSSVNTMEESINSDMVDNLKSTKFSLKDVKYINNTVSGGPYHILAIKNNGELIFWGDNVFMGAGCYIETPSQAVKVMDNVKSVFGDYYLNLAIDKDGDLWAWGQSGIWRMLNNFRDDGYDYNSPIKIMDNVKTVECGSFNTLFIVKNDKSLWGWGGYAQGQLADGRYDKNLIEGNPLDKPTWYDKFEMEPVKIMDDVEYAMTGSQNYALKSDGSLWAWGKNENGELGDGTINMQLYPIKIMDNVKLINKGVYKVGNGNVLCSMYAVKNDNTLWTWGSTENKKTNKNFQEDLLPGKIMDNVVYAAGLSGEQSVVIKEDGSLWTWGKNNFGQLGDGTTIDREEPMKVMDNVVYAAGNNFCTVALKNDGSLWLMGMYNDIGNETENQIYKPHKIMDNIMLPY